MKNERSIQQNHSCSRRRFLQQSAATSVAVCGALSLARNVHAAGSDTIRVGLIGCGGRGSGAAINAMNSKANVKLVAMADAFKDSLENSLANITKESPNRIDVPENRRFVGLDAYQKLIDSDVDLVLLCTPPGFRPMQFEAAVKAGKHVFLEKPLATDAPGVRRIMAANEEAKRQGLAVAVGHHFRHDERFRESIQRIHGGAIGDLTYLRSYYTDPELWIRPRLPEQSEMQYQIRNWYYFTWLSGDHIVEQDVHNIDISNWIAKGHPVEAQGVGGRQVRVGKEVGEIYDHHAVEFIYPNGLRAFNYYRQISGCWQAYSNHAHGAKGHVDLMQYGDHRLYVGAERQGRWKQGADGHQTEMDDLLASLLAGKPYNEADWAAESTMTAILGRMATYSGQLLKWDDAINSQLNLTPKSLAWNSPPLVKPGADGCYACAMPGITKAW
jgi:predicted dehydrogenase